MATDPGQFTRTVARIVKGLVAEAGVTQVEIAGTLGRAQGYVSPRINGRESWTLNELDQIAPLIGFRDGLDLFKEVARRSGAPAPLRAVSDPAPTVDHDDLDADEPIAAHDPGIAIEAEQEGTEREP